MLSIFKHKNVFPELFFEMRIFNTLLLTLSSSKMEPSTASRELCRDQSRACLISPVCTSVKKRKTKIDQEIIKNIDHLWQVYTNSFRTCCLSSDSTCNVHYRPHIYSHWSKQCIWREVPTWILQPKIQWSCTNSSIWIWSSWNKCWIFWNTFHKKGSSYIFSHRL